MKKVIFLTGVAMCCILNTINAQFLRLKDYTSNTKYRNEIGLTVSKYNTIGVVFRKEYKENKFWRVDGSFSGLFLRNPPLRNYSAEIGFGLEKNEVLNSKFIFYHGLNIGAAQLSYSNYTYNGNDFVLDRNMTNTAIFVGYRLGLKCQISNRISLGLEVNPQIGVKQQLSSQTQYSNGGLQTIGVQSRTPYISNGGIQLTTGFRF